MHQDRFPFRHLLRPAPAHLNRLLPFPKSLILLLSCNLGVEGSHPSRVYVLQFLEILPDADCKTGCDGGAQRCGFEHAGTLNRDANEISLRLEFCE